LPPEDASRKYSKHIVTHGSVDFHVMRFFVVAADSVKMALGASALVAGAVKFCDAFPSLT
jgi:hypothetical protein